MRISVEFDNWEEMEAFRTSGKKSRGKKGDVDEVTVEEQAAATQPVMGQPINAPATPPPSHGFPGANGAVPPPAALHPLATAIIGRIDSAIGSGQPADAILNWFRQQIGPEAASATLEQLKQVFIPRMQETQLKQIAPQLGIAG